MALVGEGGMREGGVDPDELEHPPQGLEPPVAKLFLLDQQNLLAGVEAKELL